MLVDLQVCQSTRQVGEELLEAHSGAAGHPAGRHAQLLGLDRGGGQAQRVHLGGEVELGIV